MKSPISMVKHSSYSEINYHLFDPRYGALGQTQTRQYPFAFNICTDRQPLNDKAASAQFLGKHKQSVTRIIEF
jgi:hypothetical protein